MAGHGEKLTRKQEQAIVALLSHSTMGDAARSVGVSESTLGRWLQRPDFQAVYRQHRRQLLDRSLTGLQKATGEAVDTLVRNLGCGVPAVEVRAAVALLDLSWKGTHLLDESPVNQSVAGSMIVAGGDTRTYVNALRAARGEISEAEILSAPYTPISSELEPGDLPVEVIF